MNVPLKFTAKSVDNIEKKFKLPIENLLSSLELANLAQFIERGYYNDETEKIGVTNDRSFEILEEYLADGGDKEDFLLDIMEALQTGGFLSRKLDLAKIRQNLVEKTTSISTEIEDQLNK